MMDVRFYIGLINQTTLPYSWSSKPRYSNVLIHPFTAHITLTLLG